MLLEAHVESPGFAQFALFIPPNLRCLRGHFPGFAVVPAAVLLGWALAFASEFMGSSPVLRGLRSVKFRRLVVPGQTLNLTIKLDPDGDAIQFEYGSVAGRHSSGHVLLGAANG